MADISPVPKCKPPQIDKLRPISLLPKVSKVFERLLLDKIQPIFLPQIYNNQFGFMPKSSTTSCLLHMQEIIGKLLDMSSIAAVTIISFDLRRAFDSVPHTLLIEKISQFAPKSFCHLIKHYLSNRFQQVKVKNIRSNQLRILSGVPQGAILSPILFNVFINDLSFGSDCYLFKYADDTTIILPHFNSSSAVTASHSINIKIRIMQEWCKNNYLTLNEAKTQIIMTIKRQRTFHCDFNLSRLKILGVIFSKNMKWDEQINYLTKKAARNIYLLKVLKPLLTKKELILVYQSCILSILDYSSSLYIHLPHHLSQKIDKLARRCHSIICYFGCKCSQFIIPSAIRIQRAVNLFRKASKDPEHPLHPIIPSKLPKTKKFCQPPSFSERRKKCFIPTITEIINNC